METKTIVLKEFEGKRYELHLLPEKIKKLNIEGHLIFAGPVSDFISNPYKEEIAEKVVGTFSSQKHRAMLCKDYSGKSKFKIFPLDSLLSAIGDYKYFILTETTI